MNKSKTALRALAIYEGLKGALVLLAGFGALSLVHHNVRLVAAALVGRLHVNPASGFARSFIEASDKMTDGGLWLMVCIGFLYACLRFFEAYGLWFGRAWAEWLAIVGCGVFIPVEVYELVERLTLVRVTAVAVNLLVIYALIVILIQKRRNQHTRNSLAPTAASSA